MMLELFVRRATYTFEKQRRRQRRWLSEETVAFTTRDRAGTRQPGNSRLWRTLQTDEWVGTLSRGDTTGPLETGDPLVELHMGDPMASVQGPGCPVMLVEGFGDVLLEWLKECSAGGRQVCPSARGAILDGDLIGNRGVRPPVGRPANV